MTLFARLNPGRTQSPRSAITVLEVKEGLQYEVILVMDFIKFLISVLLWGSCWVVYPVLTLATSIFFLAWSVAISLWRPDSESSPLSVLRSHAVNPITYLPLLLLAQLFLRGTWLEVARDTSTAITLGNMLYCTGFHPDCQYYIHVPLSNPKVLTGLCLLLFLTAVYQVTLALSGVSFSYVIMVWYTYAFSSIVVAATTLCFAAKAALTAAETKRPFKIFSPLYDVFLSAKSVLNFRTQTGLRVSSFIRMLSAQAADDESLSDTLSYHSLMDWLDEDRGVAAWEFLCLWKQFRLGRRRDESEDRIPSDVLQAINMRRMTEHLQTAKREDQPLRSPLLRGY